MATKNRDKDRWTARMRSPWESTFSKISKRIRYRGLFKNKFHSYIEALVYNFKKLPKLNETDLVNNPVQLSFSS
ncbi:hypothetical protein FACS1894152_6580 [Bacilli bacterium]|nr:hypothetical protein FACS1894152_6560 [Bacilli bacterium]GHU28664.1 hypothetical protein FACS1894152_6580 [Bacilli bacterium]